VKNTRHHGVVSGIVRVGVVRSSEPQHGNVLVGVDLKQCDQNKGRTYNNRNHPPPGVHHRQIDINSERGLPFALHGSG
jgi:hypothetical protein